MKPTHKRKWTHRRGMNMDRERTWMGTWLGKRNDSRLKGARATVLSNSCRSWESNTHTTGTTLVYHFIVFHAASVWILMGRNGKRLLMALRFFPLFTTLERFWKFRMISGTKLGKVGKYLATVARILREQHTICSPFHHLSFGDHPDCWQFQTVFSHPSRFEQPWWYMPIPSLDTWKEIWYQHKSKESMAIFEPDRLLLPFMDNARIKARLSNGNRKRMVKPWWKKVVVGCLLSQRAHIYARWFMTVQWQSTFGSWLAMGWHLGLLTTTALFRTHLFVHHGSIINPSFGDWLLSPNGFFARLKVQPMF